MLSTQHTSLEDETSQLHQDISRVLFTQEAIRQRIGELGRQISSDYADLNPLFVGVLKGVVFFMSDLMRAISIPARIDFMAISRYASQGQPHDQVKGTVRLIKDLEETVDGQHVIFVEDVIDTGLTLNYLLRILKTRSPASLEVCALFDKKEHRLVNTPVKYIGFDLPSRFVVGYGLDYRGGYRHLPFVGELRPELLNLTC